MTDAKKMAEQRRVNLQAWMTLSKMSKSDLATILGVGRAYVSLLWNPTKFFGEKAARSIELKLHMPTHYLDSDHSQPLAVAEWSEPSDLPDGVYALVPRVEVSLAAGNGSLVDIERQLPPLAFRTEWLRKKCVTARANLRVVEIRGDSMENYLQDGDLVLIDTGQKVIKDSDVYAIGYADEVRIKRLCKRFDGGLLIRSDNPRFPEESLSHEEAESIRIIGRMLWRAG